MTFDEAWPLIDAIGGFYGCDELAMLWRMAAAVPPGGAAVEVGCEKGRSTSCILLAMPKDATLDVVDPFTDHPCHPIEKEFRENMLRLGRQIGGLPGFRLHLARTDQIAVFPVGLDLVHLDGAHQEDAVAFDCNLVGPRVKVGGCIVFHDYGRDSLPGVKLAVDAWLAGDGAGWRKLELADTALAVEKQ